MHRRPFSAQPSKAARRNLKVLLAGAASLVLMLPAAALAQDHGHGDDPHDGGAPHGGGPGGGPGGGHGPAPGVFHGYDGRDYRQGEAYSGDRRGFANEFRSAQKFRAGAYRRPGGWYAHQWRHGEILPPIFWTHDYWLLDYWLFSLSPPPYGYVWVRYGSDALLIDQHTGEIVEVIYGAFY
jgi:Ni/Co efflux regulator RcnB